LPSISRLYYATKANGHPAILKVLADEGFGMECVSAAEVSWVREHVGAEVPVLLTPNFCPVNEYAQGFDLGAEVTIDGPEVLLENADLFAGRKIALRIDPGGGLGHHEKVVTAGAHAKFGHPARDLKELLEAVATVGAEVVGLHAHVGSGILDSAAWAPTATLLGELARAVPSLQWIDIGGGLGVVERPGQSELDLAQLETSLSAVKAGLGRVELRMEPGRYLVSEAGVLIAPVTQVRRKGEVSFIGLATGMNSLLRPALYGAWHGIHNLSRLHESGAGYHHIVGPICETGDVLGRDRLLPKTHPGDVLLVENCGAYGAVMSSRYNRRDPADEIVLAEEG
jgi:diaminopimelate decarboxylase/aspartate kinase